MKYSPSKIIQLATFALGLMIVSAKSETLTLDDITFTVNNVPAGAAGGILSGRWGTWDSGSSTFIQSVTSALNAGYVDLSGPELSITLNQTTNGTYTAGTALALAIFTNGSADAQALNFSSATSGVVLTDAAWVAPSFANNANMLPKVFSNSTVARIGSFTYSASGNDILTLAVIPEPSSLSLLAMGSLALVCARFGRKS
jgi:hypothetical protein